MRRTVILTALLAFTAPAAAHDLWLDPAGNGVQILYGHPHEPELPSAGKLMSLTAYEPSGAVALNAKLQTGAMPALKAAHQGDALFAAAYDNGYWVRLSDGGYRNASKRMLPQADKSLWSVKFAKAVSPARRPRGTRSSANRWRSSRWRSRPRLRARSGCGCCSRAVRSTAPAWSPPTA
ncbi:putative GH25 family protein [Methylorubrum extorquens]|nr:putative GH25 family protein [Methylorubrum extorquens]